MKSWLCASLITIGAVLLPKAPSQTTTQQHLGPLTEGGFLLNNGWTLRPAGVEIPVDTFPMSSAVSSDGKYLLVLHGGYRPPSISVVDIEKKQEQGRTSLPDAWLGLIFAPKSNTVYAGGGAQGKIYELKLDPATGTLVRTREFTVISPAGKAATFIGDVAISPDAHLLYAADLYNDSVAVINLQSGQLIDHWKTGRRPYRLLVAPGGRRLFVSSWADGTVTQLDANSGAEFSRTRVGPHATDMLLLSKAAPTEEGRSENIARLFVAASNTNNVYSFGVTREGNLTLLETINLSLTPMHPLGMTPSALATDEGGNRLFTICSDANAVAVTDISQQQSRTAGYIPTGWYPTAVRVMNNGGLIILNGKGVDSRANASKPETTSGSMGRVPTGTVQFVPPITEEGLPDYTATVRRNSPYRDESFYKPVNDPQTSFFAQTQEHPSPIQHVVYIINGNRTYDQVLGDLGKGNGDKSSAAFGEQVTPNLHQLARDFVVYDNFYGNADSGAEGHNWATAALAPDYTVKMWPSEYAGRKKGYDFEGGEPANVPPTGYLWTNAIQAGIRFRNYGEWAENFPLQQVTGTRQIEKVRDLALVPYTDMNFRSFDPEYSDVDRAKEFIREWKEFDNKGQAPQLSIVRLSNDRTFDTKAGALTPASSSAANDYAVGLLTEAVSHSKFWNATAIFVIESDTQHGPDHVNSYRAPAWVISPYTQRGGIVDSALYNQTSVLRTIEMIVGLRPMTQFDAGAKPMFASFNQQLNAKPFTAISPKVPLTDRANR